MSASKPWAGVIRVSHMGARRAGEADVHTDRDQADAIEGEARRMGVTVHMLEPELDVKGSWGLDRRPSLRSAVEGVERGRYAGIIVAYLSRLGRNVREQLAVWDRVEAAGGSIIVVRERIDTSTPSGRMTRTILSAVDERELEEHAERFAQLREWATAAGIWQRRQTPRGYSKDPQTRRLVPDERTDEVRWAFRALPSGTPITHIAERLGMSPSGVRQMIRNRVYLGELRVGEHVNPNAHPAIVTEDEWLAAQEATPTRPPRSRQPIALLAGMVRCASCGHVMSRATSNRKWVSYSCHGSSSAGKCPGRVSIGLATLDEHVLDIALPELAKLSGEATGQGEAIREARAAVATAERELAAYLEGVRAAGLEPAQFAAGARTRREAVEQANAALATLLAGQRDAIDGDPVAMWDELTAGQRNRLLRGLIECVLVAPAGRGKRVPVHDRVRVIAHGAGLVEPYRGGGTPLPIRTIALPDLDDPVVLAGLTAP